MLKQFYLFVALFWTGTILFFCLIKSSNIPTISIPNLDKIIHSFLHFVFVVLWFLVFKKKSNGVNFYNNLVVSFFFSFVFGILIELLQQFFTTTRQADILDIVANVFGAALAFIGIVLLNKFSSMVDKI